MKKENKKKILQEGKRYYANCISCYNSGFANISRSKHKISAK